MRTVKLYHGVRSIRDFDSCATAFRLDDWSRRQLRWHYRVLRRAGVVDSTARMVMFGGILVGRDSLRNEQP